MCPSAINQPSLMAKKPQAVLNISIKPAILCDVSFFSL